MINFKHLQPLEVEHPKKRESSVKKWCCLTTLFFATFVLILMIVAISIGLKIFSQANSLSPSVDKIPPIVNDVSDITLLIKNNLQQIINYYYSVSQQSLDIIAQAEIILKKTLDEEYPLINQTLDRVEVLIDKIEKLLNSTLPNSSEEFISPTYDL